MREKTQSEKKAMVEEIIPKHVIDIRQIQNI